jgi:hypothetical protein
MSEPVVASVVMNTTGADQVPLEIPTEPAFTWDDAEALSRALRAQGTWFLGIECRTKEQSRTLAQVLLMMLRRMGYENLTPKPGGPIS